MYTRAGTATGKIILSGEYAMLFGYPGIAIPTKQTISATLHEDATNRLNFLWDEVKSLPMWPQYVLQVMRKCTAIGGQLHGTLEITSTLPLGKGLGSSTALIIALARCFLGEDCKEHAKQIEDECSPGNSGVDFAAIWEGTPIVFTQNSTAEPIELPNNTLHNSYLLDTGLPNEQTSEMVKWMKSREQEVLEDMITIRDCTEAVNSGENILEVVKRHHRAQVRIGVVPEGAQQLIASIEKLGGAAKVTGAGGKTGGAGMVLSLGIPEDTIRTLSYPYFPVT